MASPGPSARADGMPACWDDDVRMNALFAPCKHHSIAPEAWRQKMTFWSEELRAWCRRRRSPLVSVTAARQAFARKGTRPACLHVVLDEYVRSGEYVPARTYSGVLAGGGEGWVRWGARLALRPAALAVGVLAAYLPLDRAPRDGMAAATIDHEALYVNQVVVKELATELLRSYPEGAERVGTLAELMEACGYSAAERDAFEVLLGYMITAGLAVKKGDLYKLAESDSTKVCPVSECEEALHRLVSAERRLAADGERFRREEERALADTRLALREGDKPQAKAHLRRKHRCAERAGGCDAALDNVRSLLDQLRQAEVNSAIVDTYKMSMGAMKRTMKQENLDEDSAAETMEELREVMESYSAVEKSLAGGLDDYDAAELEDELEVLLATGPRGGAPDESGASPATERRRQEGASEKEFVFDGEARMMAELAELSTPRARARVAVPLADAEPAAPQASKPAVKKQAAPKQDWYPRSDQALSETEPAREAVPWVLRKIENVEGRRAAYSLDALANSMTELRTDPRLHPGQKLDPRFSSSTGPVMYNTDFQVQDHKLDDGVWIFNPKDDDGGKAADAQSAAAKVRADKARERRTASETEFSNSEEYPGDAECNANAAYDSELRKFQMAPGGERPSRHEPWNDEDEEKGFEDLERRLKNLRSFK